MDLKTYLAEVGETQEEFAKRARVSQPTVSRVVSKRHSPRGDVLDRLLRAIERKPPRQGTAPTIRDLLPKRKKENSR